MTSVTRLRRRLHRWARFSDRVTPGWASEGRLIVAPRGLQRAWRRHDAEQLRRNVLLWQRARMEADRGA